MRQVVGSRKDLAVWADNNLETFSQTEREMFVENVALHCDRPDYGTDWTEWFGALTLEDLQALAAE